MRLRWVVPAVVVVAWVLIGGPLASLPSVQPSVQRNDSTAFLPAGAESTAVLNLDHIFEGRQTSPAILVYARPGGLTDADWAKIAADTKAIVAGVGPVLDGPAVGPVRAPKDDEAAQVILPFSGSDVDILGHTVTDIR